MGMNVDHDQWLDDVFMWENQSSGPFNSDKSDESIESLDIELMSQKLVKEEENLANKKRSRGGVGSKSGSSEVTNDKGKDGNYCNSSHEKHVCAERERRGKIRSMFDSLQSLIPHLTYKVDDITLVDEAVNYITFLQQTLENLEKQKQEKLRSFRETFLGGHESSSCNMQMVSSNALSTPSSPLAFDQRWSSQNVTLNIFGDEAQFCIYSTKKSGLLTKIAYVMEKHKIDVIYANIVCIDNGKSYMIQAHVKRTTHQFLNAISVEESYKLAAGEIMDLLKF